MKGIYIFKQDGVEIARSENVITTDGKTSILQYLVGTQQDWASHIAIGAIETEATVDDKTLYFEIARTPVTLKSFSSISPNLMVKGTFDASFAANIYEVGVYPTNNSSTFGVRNNLIISDFSTQDVWTDDGSQIGSGQWTSYLAQSPSSPRVGMYALTVPSNKTYTNAATFFDISKYSTIDTLDVLVGPVTSSSGSKSFTVKFTNTKGDNASLSYSLPTSTAWKIISIPLTSEVIAIGSISQIDLITESGLSVMVDSIKINIAAEVDNTTSLVSRSVLTTPIAKIYGSPLDIEYYLDLS